MLQWRVQPVTTMLCHALEIVDKRSSSALLLTAGCHTALPAVRDRGGKISRHDLDFIPRIG